MKRSENILPDEVPDLSAEGVHARVGPVPLHVRTAIGASHEFLTNIKEESSSG